MLMNRTEGKPIDLPRAMELLEDEAEAQMGTDFRTIRKKNANIQASIIYATFERFHKTVACRGPLFVSRKQQAKIVVGLDIVAIQANRGPEILFGFGRAIGAGQQNCQIVVRLGELRRSRDRLTKQSLGRFELRLRQQ